MNLDFWYNNNVHKSIDLFRTAVIFPVQISAARVLLE